MAASATAWVRRPGNLFRLAIGLTLVAIASLAPMYLQSLWPAAQVPTAPWHVALVREPFFAWIMMFTYAPGYMPWLYAIWTMAIASWAYLILARRRAFADFRAPDTGSMPAE